MAEVDEIQARLKRDLQSREQDILARDTEINRLKDQLISAEREAKVRGV